MIGIAISHSCIFKSVHLPIHHQLLLSTDRRSMSCTVLLFTLVALRFICHAISHIILPPFLCLSAGYFSFFYRRLLRLNGKPRIFISFWAIGTRTHTPLSLNAHDPPFFTFFAIPLKSMSSAESVVLPWQPAAFVTLGYKVTKRQQQPKAAYPAQSTTNHEQIGTASSGVHLNTSK